VTASDPSSAGTPATRLRPVSLREQAREALRARIVLGQIEPGEVRSVISLAEELGVSVTPVREAVMDLAHHGMVEVIRNRGFRVPQLSEHDLDEIFRTTTSAPTRPATSTSATSPSSPTARSTAPRAAPAPARASPCSRRPAR
jgi:DNA-binding FadR family transcriptional regulator